MFELPNLTPEEHVELALQLRLAIVREAKQAVALHRVGLWDSITSAVESVERIVRLASTLGLRSESSLDHVEGYREVWLSVERERLGTDVGLDS